jgi:hypothetical protein
VRGVEVVEAVRVIGVDEVPAERSISTAAEPQADAELLSHVTEDPVNPESIEADSKPIVGDDPAVTSLFSVKPEGGVRLAGLVALKTIPRTGLVVRAEPPRATVGAGAPLAWFDCDPDLLTADDPVRVTPETSKALMMQPVAASPVQSKVSVCEEAVASWFAINRYAVSILEFFVNERIFV